MLITITSPEATGLRPLFIHTDSTDPATAVAAWVPDAPLAMCARLVEIIEDTIEGLHSDAHDQAEELQVEIEITHPARNISPHPEHVAADLRRLCASIRDEWLEGDDDDHRASVLAEMIDWLESNADPRLAPDSIAAALAFFRRVQAMRADVRRATQQPHPAQQPALDPEFPSIIALDPIVMQCRKCGRTETSKWSSRRTAVSDSKIRPFGWHIEDRNPYCYPCKDDIRRDHARVVRAAAGAL